MNEEQIKEYLLENLSINIDIKDVWGDRRSIVVELYLDGERFSSSSMTLEGRFNE